MDYKKDAINTYNVHADAFYERTESAIARYLKPCLDDFLGMLAGRRILDVGCGTGRDMTYFKRRGFDPVGIDLADRMLEICRKRGLDARSMDFEDIVFPEGEFDGVWAHTSLHLVPKEKLPPIIDCMKRMMKPAGVLCVCVIEGTREGVREEEKYPGTKRWVSEYLSDELRALLEEKFEIERFSRVVPDENDDSSYLYFLCRKR